MLVARSKLKICARLALGAALVASLLAGCGGGEAPKSTLGNDSITSIQSIVQSGDIKSPHDSAPNPDATTVYFTATSSKGPGLFRVPTAGGAATEVIAGKPFVAPIGLAISTNGQQIYVADSQAGDSGKGGQVFVVQASGGSPTTLNGSAGTVPRGLDIVSEGGQDVVYFTGKDPSDGQPAVFKIPAAGGSAPAIVAKGAPLIEPDGVTVTKAGVVYVSDRAAAGGGFGSVFKIADSKVTPVVAKVRTGDPAGVALTLDEQVLLVSALQPDRDSDQVLLVDLNTLQTGSVTKVVEQNSQAGGVHRARNSNSFSWCGSPMGPIFKIMAGGA